MNIDLKNINLVELKKVSEHLYELHEDLSRLHFLHRDHVNNANGIVALAIKANVDDKLLKELRRMVEKIVQTRNYINSTFVPSLTEIERTYQLDDAASVVNSAYNKIIELIKVKEAADAAEEEAEINRGVETFRNNLGIGDKELADLGDRRNKLQKRLDLVAGRVKTKSKRRKSKKSKRRKSKKSKRRKSRRRNNIKSY